MCCVCVRVCVYVVRGCVRACVRACVCVKHACVHASMHLQPDPDPKKTITETTHQEKSWNEFYLQLLPPRHRQSIIYIFFLCRTVHTFLFTAFTIISDITFISFAPHTNMAWYTDTTGIKTYEVCTHQQTCTQYPQSMWAVQTWRQEKTKWQSGKYKI